MLITEEYRQQNANLHIANPAWGTTARSHAPSVQQIVYDYDPHNILDYGCGKQTLGRALPHYRIKGYDPALPGLDTPPEPHDLVVCLDVLEHVEPDCLEDVLDDLQRVTTKHLYVLVCTVDAHAVLPDGRNAHLIVKECRWWMGFLWDRFDVVGLNVSNVAFSALLAAKLPKGNGIK